ncbi:NADP-dependent oxidoreductase [Rhizorhapis sp. SPR117]|uniref:NADP-dependent oxidoreductase n=1 Tax=Rhizorhapis sp. SPR117 TaxID=2912611 RepID=UPI001F409B38|nr:NADP-dependent oxidoreductase [Rhizorhapis sp. SPR117]
MKAAQIFLKERPAGEPTKNNFDMREVDLPELQDGEVLVENKWMSVDPYMRLYLSSKSGAHAPLPEGHPMTGGCCGIVSASRCADVPEGTAVVSEVNGWRDRYVEKAENVRVVDASKVPLQLHIGLLSRTGVTASAGMLDILKPGTDDIVFVSSAAGGVGSVAVQLAKIAGAKVIGSAGTDAKGQWITNSLGVDHFINYRTEDDLAEAIRACAPDGITRYFDNVGGNHLDAALSTLRPRGVVAACGSIGLYNSGNYRAGPQNYFAIMEKGISILGFNATLWNHRRAEFLDYLEQNYLKGDIVWREHITDGLDHAVDAFLDVLTGQNIGKALVKISS